MDSIKCGCSPNSKKIVIILHVPIVWTYSGVIIPNLKVIAFTRQLMTRGPFQTRNKMKFLNNFKQFMISLTNFTLFCGAILNLSLDSSILDVFSAYSQVRTNLKCQNFFFWIFPLRFLHFCIKKRFWAYPQAWNNLKCQNLLKIKLFVHFSTLLGGIHQRTKTEFGISKSIPGYSYFWVAASGYQTYSFLLG